MLPSGWSIKTVGDLFDVQLGKMLNQAAKEKEPQYKYLGNTNVQWAKFNFSELKGMHFNQRELIKFKLEKNDILMCEGGEVGRCAIWDLDEPIYYQKALHRLRSKGGIEPIFFQNFMEKIAGTKLLDDYTTKTSIAHLTQEKLIQIPIKLPPPPEQKKIAQILSTWDKAIATTEKLLENSQKQKQALMQQLLTGKKRFSGFSGNWSHVKMSEIANIEKGKAISSEDIFIGEYPVIAGGKSSPYKHNSFTHENVITVSASGAYAGYVAYQPNKIWASDCSAISAKSNSNIKYIFFYLEYQQKQIYSLQSGGAQPHIYPKDLGALKLELPSVAEQEKIASVLNEAEKGIQTIETKLELLKEEKKALMQQLLTGKRRVRV